MGKGHRRRYRRQKRATHLGAFLNRLHALYPRLPKSRSKRVATAILVLISASLMIAFTFLENWDAIYVLVLAASSLGLLLWALPNVKLALTSVFLFSQPLLIFLGNSTYLYSKVIFSLWFISLLVLLWIGEMVLRRRGDLQLTSLVWPAVMLLIAALLSLINSESLPRDLQYIVLLVYFVLFYLYLANTLESTQEIKFLLGAILGSAALAALYGFLQYYGVTPYVSGGKQAILSTFGNRNYLGGFLAYLFVPGLYFFTCSKTLWTRLFAFATLGLTIVMLAIINSDSSWLAWLLSLLAMLGGLGLIGELKRLHTRWSWKLSLIGAPLILAFIGISVSGLLGIWAGSSEARPSDLESSHEGIAIFEQAREFAQMPGRIAETRSLQTRVAFWLIGYEMFREHPIVGIGLGDYKSEFLPYKAKFYSTELGQDYKERLGSVKRAAQAHNDYVQIGSEMGVLGLLAAFLIIVRLLHHALQRLREENASSDIKWTIIALTAGVVAFMSDAFFSFPLHLPPNALVIVLLMGMLQSKALGRPQFHISLKRLPLAILASIVLIIALGVSTFAYRDWLADIYLTSGAQLLARGDERGIRLVEKSAELDIAPGEAYYWLGAYYVWKGESEKASKYLEQAQPQFNSEFSYYLLAIANLQQRNLEATQHYLGILLAMDPPPSLKAEARYVRAVTLSQQGKTEDSIALFQDLLQSGYEPIKVHINIGEVYLQKGELERAEEHLKRAFRLIERELSDPGTQDSSRRQELESLKWKVETLLRRLNF